VVVADGAVVVATRHLQPVLDGDELIVEVRKALVREELGVVLGHREEGPQALGQAAFFSREPIRARLGQRGRPGARHPLEDVALVLGVALNHLDEVGQQVVSQLELDIDPAPRLVRAVLIADEPVVRVHEPHESETEGPDRDRHPGSIGQSRFGHERRLHPTHPEPGLESLRAPFFLTNVGKLAISIARAAWAEAPMRCGAD